MQQRGGDFNSLYYHQHPQPSPANAINYPPPPSPSPSPSAAVSYASAPPYSVTTYGSTSEFSSSSSSSSYHHRHHPPFPHNSDPVPSLSSPPPPAAQYFAPPESTHGPEATGLYPSPQPPPHYSPYDPLPLPAPATSVIPSSSNFYPNPIPNPNPNLNPNPYSSLYPSNFDIYNSSGQSSRETTSKLNKVSAYSDNKTHHIGADWMTSRSDLGPDVYGSRTESDDDWGPRSTPGMYGDDGSGDGAYAYKGNGGNPYGARGTWSGMFDDYGRAISFPSSDRNKSSALKVVKAIPKAEALSDAKGTGVQKFRVKLLAESGGQSTMDVLCQVGLDGIRMLDPSTSRTLRIYPLENVTRCEKFDSSTLAFWSKTSVDIEPRRIRVQSNSYTTSTLLDTITAAVVQLKEIGGRILPPESSKVPERPVEKKKGLTDWVNKLKPTYEEKDHWVPDEAISKCTGCGTDFSTFVRKHHCRNCGDIFCDKCTHGRIALTADENAQPVRVCDRCMGEVTRRLSSAKESASRSVVVRSHEDLSKKLQEEMERNRRSSSGSKTDGSGRRMKEVACPTCTVHLQVQVPSSGSETIECGVCQRPFLVNSH